MQCVHNLAEFYQECGMLERADFLCRQVLGLRARVLGSEHKDADVESHSDLPVISKLLHKNEDRDVPGQSR